MVEIYRFLEIFRGPQWNSSYNKVYCRVVIEINQFFGCYSLSLWQTAKLKQIYMSSLQIFTNSFILPRVTIIIVRKAFRTVKHYPLTKFVLRIIFLTFIVVVSKKWLSERGYSEKLVPKETVKAGSQSRETLLDIEKMSRNDDRFYFNIAYYPFFKNIRNILEELHFLLGADEQLRKLFTQ